VRNVNKRLFKKYDILTEFLKRFWFAMLVNEYTCKLEFQLKKVHKMRNIVNIPMVGSRPLECMCRTDLTASLTVLFQQILNNLIFYIEFN
jgi:hypothetical protein